MHKNHTEVSQKRYRYCGKEKDNESGLYYYGARYYADWLCRFTAVDPRKDQYPFQNSYAYAANNPITFTDVNGEGPGDEIDQSEKSNKKKKKSNLATPPSSGKELMQSTPRIDMTDSPNPTSYTIEGAPRDKSFFWKQHQEIEPESLSKSNLYRVNELDLSPKVDDTWIQYHPEHKAYKGEVLHHHHIDHGNMATAVPAKAHYDFFSELHPKIKSKIKGGFKGQKIKGIASQLPSIIGELGDLAALLNGNPDNFYWMLLPPEPKINRVQALPGLNNYFTPIEIIKTYYDDSDEIKSVQVTFNVYSGYLWDEDKGEYTGADYIETQTLYFEYNKEGKTEKAGQVG